MSWIGGRKIKTQNIAAGKTDSIINGMRLPERKICLSLIWAAVRSLKAAHILPAAAIIPTIVTYLTPVEFDMNSGNPDFSGGK